MSDYNFDEIETRWQKRWMDGAVFEVTEDPKRPKFYCLEMLPYPSGDIHVGHVRNYCITDVVTRYKWMRGFNVMHPIGWDALGLPAENAAIKRGIHPEKWTRDNIAGMKRQLQRMGFSYPWSREIASCDPEYYRWNQWFFLRMLERGIAYRAKAPVNWCPKCLTVLANEQAQGGFCWRCKSTVELRELDQWFLRITAYQDQLLDDMAQLPEWPDRVLIQQRNWVGRSHGAEVDFPVEGQEPIRVFTTRVDTIYGATFMVLAPEHPRADTLATSDEARKGIARLRAQDRRARQEGSVDKEGVFTGRYATNPFSGETIPIWIGNFVLMGYGTGAIMSVPAHDQRDFEFAKKYDLPIRIVIEPEGALLDASSARRGEAPPRSFSTVRSADASSARRGEAPPRSFSTVRSADASSARRGEAPPRSFSTVRSADASMLETAYEGPGKTVNTGPFSGLSSAEAIDQMAAHAQQKGFGRKATSYRLKDWLISRQRYWGTPIPVVYCEKDGVVPVAEKDLPIVLPADAPFTGEGGNPLEKVKSFVEATCPKCGGAARRETDTMDTFVDSSWYFYRYLSPKKDDGPVDAAAVKYWFPIDLYVGGIEHAILHLVYSRFWTKVMRDLGLVSFDEPVTRLFPQGMVHKDGEVMSKSKGNTIAPDDIIKKYGADTLRLYILSVAPPEDGLEWQEEGIEGAWRFVNRVWRLALRHADTFAQHPRGPMPAELGDAARTLRRKVHQTIQKVTQDVDERMRMNTAVAAFHELVNEIYRLEAEVPVPVLREAVETLVLLMNPFTPHVTEELGERLGFKDGLVRATWPAADAVVAREDELELPVQVNGKVRARITVPRESAEEFIRTQALAAAESQIAGKEILKVVIVPNRLVNVVVK